MYDYIITKPELNEETLAHYGVVGMKWGVRRDIRRTGSISKKTKNKINKAMSKASYGKARRMLNASEKLRADYEGEKLFYNDVKKKKTQKNGAKASNAKKGIQQSSELNKSLSAQAKSKGYSYKKVNEDKTTRRANRNVAIGALMVRPPVIGAAIGGGISEYKSKKYKKRNKTKNSPYIVNRTRYYSNK